MKKINYGIIGCGMMGQEHIRNLALIEGANVLAVVEPDAEMRAKIQALKGDVEFMESVADLLAIEALDALLIASPNHKHVAQLEEIAQTRPLPLLLEKPVLTQKDDIPKLQDIDKRYPEPIWVAMEYRYMPAAAEFIRSVDQVTGELQMLTIQEHRFPFLEKVGDWNRFNHQSGGTFVEKCCHFFDLMRLIVKSEPSYVMAMGGQAFNHVDEYYEGERSDIWDHGYVLIEFENGKRACLELSMFAEGSPYQEEITAVGNLGKLECKIPGPGRFWPSNRGPAPIAKLLEWPRDQERDASERMIPVDEKLLEAGDHNGSTFYQHQNFMKVLEDKGSVEVTLDDGIRAAAIGLAAQISATERRAVHMSELLT